MQSVNYSSIIDNLAKTLDFFSKTQQILRNQIRNQQIKNIDEFRENRCARSKNKKFEIEKSIIFTSDQLDEKDKS